MFFDLKVGDIMHPVIGFIVDLIFDYLRSIYANKLDARQAWLYKENFKILKYNYGAVERNAFNICLLLKHIDGDRALKASFKRLLRNISVWKFAVTSDEFEIAREYFNDEVKKVNNALIETSKKSLPGCFHNFKFEEFKQFVDWTSYCVDDQNNDDDVFDLYYENVEILKRNVEVFSAMLPAANGRFAFQKRIESMISAYDIIFCYCACQKQEQVKFAEFLRSANKSMRFIKSKLPKGYKSIKFTPFVNQKNLASRY